MKTVFQAVLAAGVCLAAGCTDTNDNGQPDTVAPAVRKAVGRGALSVTEQAGRLAENAGTTGDIKTKLAADPQVKAYKIDVDTRKDVVTLSGEVSTEAEKARAGKIAASQKGVKSVVNRIGVRGAK